MAEGKLTDSTAIFIYSVLYLMFFSVFMFIIRGDALAFDSGELENKIKFLVSVLAAVTLGAAAASALGSGGTWVYQAALLASGVGFFYFFMNILISMLPADMPPVISLILILPPVAGLCWLIVDKFILPSGDG